MKAAIITGGIALGMFFAGCATHVSKSKQQQVQLVTQTGVYSYQRAIRPSGAPH